MRKNIIKFKWNLYTLNVNSLIEGLCNFHRNMICLGYIDMFVVFA